MTSYVRDWGLTDGLEVFKFDTNPIDNDTDGDIFDFWEYHIGWNESNDNWSSLKAGSSGMDRHGDGGSMRSQPNAVGHKMEPCLDLISNSPGSHGPKGSNDAGEDPDHGRWTWEPRIYTPYTNFRNSMPSPTLT